MQHPKLTIIIPTYNERDNIVPLVFEVAQALQGIDWAIFFVDDNSNDGTITQLESIANTNDRVDGVIRKGIRGLSGAVLTGLMYARSPYIAVMDADLQHDPKLIKRMLAGLESDSYIQVAVASRYTQSTKISGLNTSRLIGSIILTYVARIIISKKLTDPMSGFFITRRSTFSQLAPHLSHNGYKIMLDLVSGLPDKNAILEFPLIFRSRHTGQSKMDFRVLWELLLIFIQRSIKNLLPRRFLSFSLIGLVGLSIHMLALLILFALLEINFSLSQIAATAIAMLNNFLLNNYLTYQNSSLHGRKLVLGYLKFVLICTLGGLISYTIANHLLGQGMYWAISGCIGAIAAACWNYSLSKFFTWHPTVPQIVPIK